jgi:DNA repair protein RadD
MPLLEHQLPPIAAVSKHFRTRQTVKWGERDIHPPIVVNASVSSGKSLMICELAKSVREAALQRVKPQSVIVMVVQRQGELCEQNSEAGWSIGLKNSIYSASVGGRKSTHYQVVYSTEGTLARALETYRFKPFTAEELLLTPEQRARLGKCHPDLLLWDECHQIPYENPESQAAKIIAHFYDCKPHMRFCGFTGSPFRDILPIIGDTAEHLWRLFASIEPDDPEYPENGVGNGIISTEFMIEQGWVVPPIFGWPDDDSKTYDFSHLDPKGWEYDEAELDAVVSDHETLLAICTDLIEKSRDRKGVLVFAATQRHARQIAAAMKALGVPGETIGVITDKTSTKDRRQILIDAKTGAIKYTINVAVLTTGVNVPWWDTLVFMRPIGSIVLLIQAIGRVLRLLIEDGDVPMIERSNLHGMTAEDRLALIAASNKPNALVLDYADVMTRLGSLYENPVLEQAELEKAKKENKDLIECPLCATMNSPSARRCIGGSLAERCEFFWHFRTCPSCHTPNDQVARECRNKECRRMLIDPNAALSGKHYVEGESTPVYGMKIESGRGGKLQIRFELSDGRQPLLIYYPHAGKQPALNSKIWKGFVKNLPIDDRSKFRLGAMKAETIMQNLELIPVPVEISAREKNGRWTVGRMKFADVAAETENFMEATA